MKLNNHKCPTFEECLNMIKGRNIMTLRDLSDFYQVVKRTISISGDAAEVGVYRGSSAKILAELLKGTAKKIHLFDTFEGMPETNAEIDVHQKGVFHDTSLESVQEIIGYNNSVTYHKGYFPHTLTAEHDKKYSFVHVDCDIYQSTMDACEFFYPLMTIGGIILFHDYRTPDCPGVKKAVNEFFNDKIEKPIVLNFLYCCIEKQL